MVSMTEFEQSLGSERLRSCHNLRWVFCPVWRLTRPWAMILRVTAEVIASAFCIAKFNVRILDVLSHLPRMLVKGLLGS